MNDEAMLIPKVGKHKRKPNRVEDKKHLAMIRQLPCCCTSGPSVAHHLKEGFGGMSLKSGDDWTIPLRDDVHKSAHATGKPETYLMDKYGIDAKALAADLWANRGSHDGMIAAIFRARSRF